MSEIDPAKVVVLAGLFGVGGWYFYNRMKERKELEKIVGVMKKDTYNDYNKRLNEWQTDPITILNKDLPAVRDISKPSTPQDQVTALQGIADLQRNEQVKYPYRIPVMGEDYMTYKLIDGKFRGYVLPEFAAWYEKQFGYIPVNGLDASWMKPIELYPNLATEPKPVITVSTSTNTAPSPQVITAPVAPVAPVESSASVTSFPTFGSANFDFSTNLSF